MISLRAKPPPPRTSPRICRTERMLQYRIAYEVVPNMKRLAEKELADWAT